MNGSQWAGSPYGSYSNDQATNNGNSYQQAPQQHRQSVGNALYGLDGTYNLSPPPATGRAAPAQFDPREIQRIAKPLEEAPRTFLQPQSGLRPALPGQGWSHYSFPVGSIAATEPAAQNFHRREYDVQTGSVAASDSAYNSFNQTSRPLHAQIQPQNPQQPAYEQFRTPAPPQTVISDVVADRGGAPRLRGKAGPSRQKPVLPCQICRKTMKNASEANKHLLQHVKPNRCDAPGCTRTDGFATPNDLERHRKSVHFLTPIVGAKDGYICRACPEPSSGTPRKFWPRRDNFKAHIRRKHVQCDEARLLFESLCPRPADAESGYGSGGASRTDQIDNHMQQEFSSPGAGSPSLFRPTSQQGEASLFHLGGNQQFDELAGIGEGPSADSDGADRQSVGFHGPYNTSGHRLSVLSDVAGPTAMADLTSPADSVMRTPVESYSSVPRLRVSQYGAGGNQSPFMVGMQYSGEPSSNTRRKSSANCQGNDSAKDPEGDFICNELGCGKRKKRECDLRKHMKRHSRPYGCTFPNCWKRFGSRNDWKRHENGQHFLAEMWRCDVTMEGSRKCGKLFYQESLMRTHLTKKHKDLLQLQQHRSPTMTEDQQVAETAQSFHLGRDGHHHYWCGFCNRLTRQEEGTHVAWEQRFNHIGDHYDKHHKTIDSWICIEENKPKASITKEDRKKAKQRFRAGRLEEDSDLGDDGIVGLSPLVPVPGYTAPAPFAPPGHGPGMPVQGVAYTSNNKRRRVEEDADADGESDDEWSMR